MPVALAIRSTAAATPAAPTFDAVLTFASATSDSEAGVMGVVGATDAEQSFEFTSITPRTGLPRDLEISEGGTLKLVVTFPADYDGQAYRYTTTAGVQHSGTFPSGNGTANY